jgi:hypothetical protein
MESWIIALIVIVFFFSCLMLFWLTTKQHTIVGKGIQYIQTFGKEQVKHTFPENIKRDDFLKWIQKSVFNSKSVQDMIRGN